MSQLTLYNAPSHATDRLPFSFFQPQPGCGSQPAGGPVSAFGTTLVEKPQKIGPLPSSNQETPPLAHRMGGAGGEGFGRGVF